MTAVREERRLVTCMFVDVVGSTELTVQWGAERLKRELGSTFSEVAAIITAHGGTVEKYIGDAIYAIFGAPIAHEDDPMRALRAAEALRQACARGAAHGHPFAVRVGIETGEAVIDLQAAEDTRQQMSVGAVVNIAARLQQRAEPGEILVGPTIREATEGLAELEALAEVELKGIGRVLVWRLLGVGTTPRPSLPFVGRDAELALLGHAYERAKKGRSVLAVVSGPPGQGKTRMVQEFLRGRDECRVIATRCRPADEVGVFAPVREILGVATLDALAEQVGRLCTDDVECERVVAGLAESAGIATSRSLSGLPVAEREDEIVQAWRRYLAILGTDRLVVLAVDDIHWADPSLVRLIDRLTYGGPQILVVATARPEFAEAAGIRPSGDRFFIELEGLEEDEALRLAAAAGHADERVVARAEGNPLFLVELARARTDDTDLPLTLQGALGARLDQLPPADRTLLSLAAIAGERFTAADAAFLAQREVVETGRALAHLVDLHFLDLSDAGHRFHHGLVRDVAYGRLLSAERMRAHARFARERVHPEDVDGLAYHWWEALRAPEAEWVWAGSPDLPAMRREAFQALLAAGRRHADHFATEAAVELLERAMGFAADDLDRARVEHTIGFAYRQILRQDDAWARLSHARELFRLTAQVPLTLYLDLVQTAAAIGAFHLPPADEDVEAIANEATSAAREAGDHAKLSEILRWHATYVANRGETGDERALALADEAFAAADASGDADARRRAARTKAFMLQRVGHIDAAAELTAAADDLRDTDALERMAHLRRRAALEFLLGDLDASERTATEAVALAEPMGPHNRTHAWAELSDLFMARGDWQRLRELAHRTARLVREEKASAFCRMAAGILRDGAVAHALAGEREEAMDMIRAMPRGDVEFSILSSVPRAILGFPSPEADERLRARGWRWTTWVEAVHRAVILRRPGDAEDALGKMGRIIETSPVYRAFAEGVREAIAELRGGPPATYGALSQLGLNGWIDVLRRRVDAEY